MIPGFLVPGFENSVSTIMSRESARKEASHIHFSHLFGAFLTPKINSKHRVSFEFPSSKFHEWRPLWKNSKETRRKLDASSKFYCTEAKKRAAN